MRMCHFRMYQNGPFVQVQTIIITFIYLLAISIVQNFKKFLQRIQSYDDVPFLGSKQSICPKQIFSFRKLSLSFSFTYQPLSLCKILKLFQQIQSYEDAHIWTQNGPFPQMRIFSKNLSMNLVSFIHAYLHAKNQSQILIYQ